MPQKEFKPFDLIFAKVKGYPHWPGRVSKIYVFVIYVHQISNFL